MTRRNVFTAVLAVASASMQGVWAQQPLEVTVDASRVWIRAGESPVLQYRYGDVPFKPYVKELYTPGGLNVLLDAPSDHLHHHGLMFAVAVNDLNFWEETPTAGRQEQDSSITVAHASHNSGPGVRFYTTPAWARVDATGRETELFESRAIEVCQVGKLRATVVTWKTELTNPRPRRRATLSGSHYFGLGMRFVRSMDDGDFFNADGKERTVFRGEERLVRSDWCAYSAAVDGKPVTVAMLGNPGNPRHPTTWFTMARPFAYLSATLNLHEEPLSLETGERLVLRYAVVAWDGNVDQDQINRAYQWFVGDDSQAHKPMKGTDRDAREE